MKKYLYPFFAVVLLYAAITLCVTEAQAADGDSVAQVIADGGKVTDTGTIEAYDKAGTEIHGVNWNNNDLIFGDGSSLTIARSGVFDRNSVKYVELNDNATFQVNGGSITFQGGANVNNRFVMNGGTLELDDLGVAQVNLSVGDSTSGSYGWSYINGGTLDFKSTYNGAGFNSYGGLVITGGNFNFFASVHNAKFNTVGGSVTINSNSAPTTGKFTSANSGLSGIWSIEGSADVPYSISGSRTRFETMAGNVGTGLLSLPGTTYLRNMLPGTLLGGRSAMVKIFDGAYVSLDSELKREGRINPTLEIPTSRFIGKGIDISNTIFHMGRNSWLESVRPPNDASPRSVTMENSARIDTQGGDFGVNEAAMIRSALTPAFSGTANQSITYGSAPEYRFSMSPDSIIDTTGRDVTIANFQNSTVDAGGNISGYTGVVLDGILRFGGNGKDAAGVNSSLVGWQNSNEENVGNINIMNATGKLTANTKVVITPSLVQGMAESIKNNPDAYTWNANNATLLINATRLKEADTITGPTNSTTINNNIVTNGDNGLYSVQSVDKKAQIIGTGSNYHSQWDTDAAQVYSGAMDYSEYLTDTLVKDGKTYAVRNITTPLGKFVLVAAGDNGYDDAVKYNLMIDSVTDALDFSKNPQDTVAQISQNLADTYGGPTPFSPGFTDAIVDTLAGQVPEGARNPLWKDRVINDPKDPNNFLGSYHYNMLNAFGTGEKYGEPFTFMGPDGKMLTYYTSRGLAEFYMGLPMAKVVQLNQDTARMNIRNMQYRFDWIHRQGDDREQAVYNAIKSGNAMASFMLPNLEYCISNRIWAGPLAQWDHGDMTRERQIAGYTYKSHGAILGFEHEHGPFTMGIAGSYQTGRYHDDAMDKNNSRLTAYSVNAYATWTSCNKWFVDALIGYMHNRNKLNFETAGLRFGQTFSGRSWYGEAKVGHDFWFGCTGQETFRITPSVGIGYINTRGNANNGVNQTWNMNVARFQAQKIPSAYIPLLVEVIKDFDLCNGGRLTLNVNGGYTYNFRQEGTENNMELAGLTRGQNNRPVNYKTWGPRRGHGMWNAGIRAKYTAKRWEIGAQYDWFGRSNANTHRLSATLGIFF